MNEQELNNVNQIDMSCQVADDDDLVITDMRDDDREVQSKTGIIINFDDEDDELPIKKITADTSITSRDIDIKSDFFHSDFEDYNMIDMETDYSEDDDEPRINTSTSPIRKNPLFFSSDEDELSGLVSSDMLDESKKATSFGDVEDDYWEKLTKKHKQTNKKGAYNTSFHFAGNPKKEQDMFNHMMRTETENVKVSDILPSNSLLSVASSSEEAGNAGFDADGVSGTGEGCCESLSDINYGEKLLELFDIAGFEVFKNSDNSIVALDKCDILPTITVTDVYELVKTLQPYLEDCLIYPLQTATNMHLDNYKDWVSWYTAERKSQFPKCANDIGYCDLLANHLHECVID